MPLTIVVRPFAMISVNSPEQLVNGHVPFQLPMVKDPLSMLIGP